MKLKCVGINTAINIEADMPITNFELLVFRTITVLYFVLACCFVLFFCMFVCMLCVCVCVCERIYLHVMYVCTHASVWVCVCMSSYLCMYVCTHVQKGVLLMYFVFCLRNKHSVEPLRW
jgi:hypothetical protein